MDIGVVVHGPNIIDSKYAEKIILLLNSYGNVSCRLGGTMGRTAVIDNSLEDMIDISRKLVPSESLKLFNEEKKDMIFLLNYGKSEVTGQVFGYKVVNNYLNKCPYSNIPLIQIERPGDDDGSIILWNGKCDNVVDEISHKLGLKKVTPEEIHEKYFKEDSVSNETRRVIHGVSPDENIMVNSIVIGKSKLDKVTLIAKDGFITDIEGGILKPHGVEKLSKVDLNKAIVKTGLLRKSNITPRVLDIHKNRDSFRIAYLNHAGEDVYKYKDENLVVTVGDDTTLISSDILYRFNVPIIGITDGDLDKVVEHGFKTKNSVIFEIEPGYDDLVGDEIFKKIFKNHHIMEFNLEIEDSNDIISQFTDSIIEILNNMNCKYNINII